MPSLTERDLVCADLKADLKADLQAAQTEARRYREALLDLFCVVKALSCPGGLSTETLREYLRTHPAVKEAANVLERQLWHSVEDEF